jgi:bifunctional non-homologous end joining protein LigD
MYATLGHAVPRGGGWYFEPKYDGMRVIAEASGRGVRLVTRNGMDKSGQFPEIVLALRAMVRRTGRSMLLDGEIVAHAGRGGKQALASGAFQRLQGRMHLKDADEILRLAVEAPASFVAFDLLRDGRTALTAKPWTERRARLETLFGDVDHGDHPEEATLLLSAASTRGASMLARARRAGWEGIIAKRSDAVYRPGTRSSDWLKLKLLFRAEFVIGGYTEPRRARPYFGALLLGAYDKSGAFVYVGHTGGGFTHDGLAWMYERLHRLERGTSPFVTPPRTNERAHWVAPKVVVEVKFSEWTSDRLLRQPIYLGTREDKPAREVTIEGVSLQRWRGGEAGHDAA